ncbi:MAG TPA: hypothetical protein DCZ92_06950 [Elusimicrobia bacterium]|nr:MAG: hypothetical protein A2016_05015 [Elusimicrobia bacterium GWF2_62_30]HBA60543.1 hypothetical protein [Elusimicrobiota bacterium]
MKSVRAGFTLVELLVVVLIIGILASVAIPQYFKIVEKGRAAEAMTALYSMGSAQNAEMLRTGAYTTDVNVLGVSATGLKFFNMSTNATALTALRKPGNAACPPADGYGCYSLVYTMDTHKITCVTAGTDSCVSLQP